jgi:hypothetical protein
MKPGGRHGGHQASLKLRAISSLIPGPIINKSNIYEENYNGSKTATLG